MLETLIDDVTLKFFYLSGLWNYYAHTYSCFDNISHTVSEKNGHPLLGSSFFSLNSQKTIKIDA